jgi:glycosyltransferase involved in cell wall biosynthesis
MELPAADRVDVILPTHRRPHTIEYAIRSVLAQTHAALRLHVVGDGCDERTEAVARGTGDARVSFHPFPKGRGFGYENRNVVLRAAGAPFVAYVNDDDLWLPDHLERALRELTTTGAALVALRSCHVQDPDRLDPHFFAFDWQGPFARRFLRHWFMGAVNCVHRREVFAAAGWWNGRLTRFGDREFYNRVRTSGLAARYVDHVTVLRFYAQHWDGRYGALAEAPQRRYLPLLADPAWRERLREAARRGPRPWSVRREQWADFLRFGLRSGPKFARFWFQKFVTARRGRAGEAGAA